MLNFGKIVVMAKAIKISEKRLSAKAKNYSKNELHEISSDGTESKVSEPGSAPYGINSGFVQWLGIPTGISKSIISAFEVLKLGSSGITKDSINNLASHIGISRKNMAEDIFNVSVKTFERKDNKEKLDKKTSSHAIEIAKVVQHAYEVFRDEAKLKLWINRENKALNNIKPVQLFDTLSGLNMVNDILGRIEHGVYS